LNDEEIDRLKISRQTHKYGHLKSWKELYCYQRTLGTPEQIKEIGTWAKKKEKGEPVTLPLKDYVSLLKETGMPETEILSTYQNAKQIFGGGETS